MSDRLVSVVGSVFIVCLLIARAYGEVAPSDLLDAVDRMTPEQTHALAMKLESRYWEPIPYGFFSRMVFTVGPAVQWLGSVERTNGRLGAAQADLDRAEGYELGILWHCFGGRTLAGLRVAGILSADSLLADGAYQRGEMVSGSGALVFNQQLLRSESWLLWIDASGGYAGLELEEVVTPAEGGSTIRFYDGRYAFGEVRGGAAWRMNPIVGLFVSGGYRFAENITLDEGDVDSGMELDASGASLQFGLAINL